MDGSMRDLLDLYCDFARCGRQHVVQEALSLAFQQDTEFQRWLQTRGVRTGIAGRNNQDDIV